MVEWAQARRALLTQPLKAAIHGTVHCMMGIWLQPCPSTVVRFSNTLSLSWDLDCLQGGLRQKDNEGEADWASVSPT